MKKLYVLKGVRLRALLYILSALAGLAACQATDAQSAVTAVFTHPVNATTATTYSGTGATGTSPSGFTGNTYTYHFGTNVAPTNNTTILDSFTTLGLNYHFQPAVEKVKFRRVDNASATGLRKSLWYEQNGSTVNPGGNVDLFPDYNDSLEELFIQRIFNIGIDNVFQNATTTNNNNIEREDVIFPGGVTATDITKAGFVVFDRGAAGSHDPFYMAAIKTLDAAGNPSAYYAAVNGPAGSYGSNIGGNVTYIIMRKNDTDPGLLMMNNSVVQNRDGIFFRFLDLGVPVNTKIYGYSMFAPDVTVSPVIKMVNYNSGTNFPTSTDLSAGGVDQLAVTGLWVTDAVYVLLPGTIDGFDAGLSNGKVKLGWQLLNIDNLQQQVIERSTDGISYSTLCSLAATKPGPQAAFDEHPLPGRNYYRLKLVNSDGMTGTYSMVSHVDMTLGIAGSLHIYPNPVRSRQLSFDGTGLANGMYMLNLYNMTGTLVFSRLLKGAPVMRQTVGLPRELPAGIYAVQLTTGNGSKVFEQSITIE